MLGVVQLSSGMSPSRYSSTEVLSPRRNTDSLASEGVSE